MAPASFPAFRAGDTRKHCPLDKPLQSVNIQFTPLPSNPGSADHILLAWIVYRKVDCQA